MKKKLNLNAAFLDANGEVNMQQVMQLISDLPEAIKVMPIRELNKLVPKLQAAVATATSTVVEGAMEEAGGGGGDEMSEEEKAAAAAKAEAEGSTDEGGTTGGDDPPKKEFGDQLTDEQKAAKKVADEKVFNDSVDARVKKENEIYATAVSKGKDFLDSTYDFASKTANDIMRDALATQSKDKFEDSELPVAFKMLKKQTSYKDFGDSKDTKTALAEIGDKEI